MTEETTEENVGMDLESREELVNTVILPCIQQVTSICQESGIDFIAVIDPHTNKISGFTALSENPAPSMFLVYAVMQAEGDFDKLVKELFYSVGDHDSIALSLLGLPRTKELKSTDPLLVQLKAIHFYASSARLTDAATFLFKCMVSMANELETE